MEEKNIIEEAREKVIEVFGYDYDINCVVNDILDRIDPDEEEIIDEIYSAIDSGLIYTEDQWKVVHYYMMPAEIGSKCWFDIMEEFHDDIMKLFGEV